METIIKEFVLFNLIENLFIVLFFLMFNKIKENPMIIIVHVFMLSSLNTILKVLFSGSILMQLFGIIVIIIYFTSIYHVKISHSIITVIISFSILLVSEAIIVIFYLNITMIDMSKMSNDFNKFLWFIPIRILEYISLYILYLIKNKMR